MKRSCVGLALNKLIAQGTSKFMFRALVTAFFTIILLSLSDHDAGSQSTRPIKLIVPLAPGGGTDILARLLAEQIGRSQGPTMVIENRPGAGTVIGVEAAMHAAPDGNTLLFNTPPFVINPVLRKLNYDPLTSFEPICHLVSSPSVIAVNSASSYGTLTDLLEAARAKPGELTLGSVGPGTASHIAFEMLKRAANVNITFVPYPGNSPSVSALLGGHVTSVFANYAEVAEQIKAGKLRALATSSRTRIEPLPDVPTVAEFGYKDYEADLWYGVVAPAKTPKETLSQLADWFTAAMQAPETKPKLVAQGFYPVGICGADFGTFIRKKYDEYIRVIRDAHIKAE
jgi:tripartite-type tricarboxylate transporter receptor subunit TctC